MTYEFHPFAAIWPLMEGEAFTEFAADIATHGQRLPIVLYQGKILDGRNRYRACTEAGIEPRVEEGTATDDEAALDLVVSLNTHRRMLSLEERSFAAARLANLKHGGDRSKRSADPLLSAEQKDPSLPGHRASIWEAAHALKVSPGSLKRARRVLDNAPELEKEIVAKKLSLNAADAKLRAAKPQAKGKPPKPAAKLPPRLSPYEQAGLSQGKWRRTLTKEDVDPEFKGTHLEFIDKYGHVWLETAEERASSRFSDWTINVNNIAKQWRGLPPALAVDIDWLRSPKPTDVEKMSEAYDTLKPVLDLVEVMLAKAKKAHLKVVK